MLQKLASTFAPADQRLDRQPSETDSRPTGERVEEAFFVVLLWKRTIMDDILVKKKIGALSASPSAYFIRKLQQKDVADKKRLRTVATLKIIRVMVHQDMYEFAVPDRTLVHELTFLIKVRSFAV